MDPNAIILLAATGVNALLKLIGEFKAQSGMTTVQIVALFKEHGVETQAAIQGYLDALPKS